MSQPPATTTTTASRSANRVGHPARSFPEPANYGHLRAEVGHDPPSPGSAPPCNTRNHSPPQPRFASAASIGSGPISAGLGQKKVSDDSANPIYCPRSDAGRGRRANSHTGQEGRSEGGLLWRSATSTCTPGERVRNRPEPPHHAISVDLPEGKRRTVMNAISDHSGVVS